MEWIKECFKYALLIIFICVAQEVVSDFCGKTYVKLYPNKYSYQDAVVEFERICKGASIDEEDDEHAEYSKFYDNKAQAESSFMLLATALHEKYATGKFRHWYILGNEKIYRCCDKDKNIIALRYVKHKAGFYFGDWEKPSYQIQFYIEK